MNLEWVSLRSVPENSERIGSGVTSRGRLFQRRLPATGNARLRSPTVESRVRRITSCEDDDDRRRRRLESAIRHTVGEIVCRQIVQAVRSNAPTVDQPLGERSTSS